MQYVVKYNVIFLLVTRGPVVCPGASDDVGGARAGCGARAQVVAGRSLHVASILFLLQTCIKVEFKDLTVT